jgi:Phage integrase central domain
MASRGTMKRRTQESELGVWRNYIEPRFGNRPVASITPAEVSAWLGQLLSDGRASATAARALATLRSILAFAVADSRLTINAAAAVKAPRGRDRRREGHALTYDELHQLHQLCAGLPAEVPNHSRVTAAEVVLVLGLTGMRLGRTGRPSGSGFHHGAGSRSAAAADRARQQRRRPALRRRSEEPSRSNCPSRARAARPALIAGLSAVPVPTGCFRRRPAGRCVSRTGSAPCSGLTG